jgi:hypothetical protein
MPVEQAIELEEIGQQPYEGMRLSAGLVRGHAVDTIYLKFERGEEEPTVILLRRDEALSAIWLLSGALWSEHFDAQTVVHDGYEFCRACGTALGVEGG